MNIFKTKPKTAQPIVYHDPFRTSKCLCGDWYTEKWNYHTNEWENDHECCYHHPTLLPDQQGGRDR